MHERALTPSAAVPLRERQRAARTEAVPSAVQGIVHGDEQARSRWLLRLARDLSEDAAGLGVVVAGDDRRSGPAPGVRQFQDEPKLLIQLAGERHLGWTATATLRPRQALVVPGGTAYREWIAPSLRTWNLLIVPYGDDLYAHCAEVVATLAVTAMPWEVRIPAAGGTLVAGLLARAAQAGGDSLLCRLLVGAVVAHLAGHHHRPSAPVSGGSPLVMRFRQLVASRLGDPDLTIAALAGELGVRAASLRRAVLRGEGVAPAQLLAHRRIAIAQQQLLAGRPVAAVAAACGYRTRRGLTRAFRAHTGRAPRLWRRHSDREADQGMPRPGA